MVSGWHRVRLLLPMPLEVSGMKQYELTTLWGLSKQSWLCSRQERERFGKIVRKWRKENPKPTLVQEMLVEDLIALHIYAQRLRDRRYFFDGEKSDYAQPDKHTPDVSTEDLKRKSSEFEKHYERIQKMKTELFKICLANSINLNLNADTDVTALFKAVDKLDGDGSKG